MNLQQIVVGKEFKKKMGYLYGWGAAVVIMGALFKIQHWPGAGIMLTVGLGVEAFIFFMSAFEPPHADPDWSLVYPELAGMYDLEGEMKKSTSQELDGMLEKAKIGPELIESLGQGLRQLSDTTSKIADVTDATVATKQYVDNVKTAAGSVSELSGVYKQTSESLSGDMNASKDYVNNIKTASTAAGDLAKSYNMASEAVKSDVSATEEYVNSIKSASNNTKELAQKYNESSEAISKTAKSLSSISVDGGEFQSKIHELSKNLGALNAVYELQLQASNEQAQSTRKLQDGMKSFIENLNESIENTKSYKEQSAILTKNISALNNVYGNMLSAMNVKL